MPPPLSTFVAISYLCLLLVSLTSQTADLCAPPPQSEGYWVWRGGSTLAYPSNSLQYPQYLAQINASTPSPRYGSGTWISADGHLYLFGGLGSPMVSNGAWLDTTDGLHQDMWVYYAQNNSWEALGDESTFAVNQAGSYPHMARSNEHADTAPSKKSIGVDPEHVRRLADVSGTWPGGRQGMATWTDPNDGSLWLFGGLGYSTSTSTVGYMNDFWQFDPIADVWLFRGGSTDLDVPDSSAWPGARKGAVTWVYDNRLWLFSGYGPIMSQTTSAVSNELRNDLWYFDLQTSLWTFLGGDTVLGSSEVSELYNIPPRVDAISWIGEDGLLWVYGGYGTLTLDPTSSSGYLNDLWAWNLTYYGWTQITTISLNAVGFIAEASGVPSPNNRPPSRCCAAAWTDAAGRLYFYGGYGMSSITNQPSSSPSFADDLWILEWAPNYHDRTWTWVSGGLSRPSSGPIYGPGPIPVPQIFLTNTATSYWFPPQTSDASSVNSTMSASLAPDFGPSTSPTASPDTFTSPDILSPNASPDSSPQSAKRQESTSQREEISAATTRSSTSLQTRDIHGPLIAPTAPTPPSPFDTLSSTYIVKPGARAWMAVWAIPQAKTVFIFGALGNSPIIQNSVPVYYQDMWVFVQSIPDLRQGPRPPPPNFVLPVVWAIVGFELLLLGLLFFLVIMRRRAPKNPLSEDALEAQEGGSKPFGEESNLVELQSTSSKPSPETEPLVVIASSSDGQSNGQVQKIPNAAHSAAGNSRSTSQSPTGTTTPQSSNGIYPQGGLSVSSAVSDTATTNTRSSRKKESRSSQKTPVTRLQASFDLMIKKKDLEFGNIIGRGSSGTIYAGRWHDQRVAIKQLDTDVLIGEREGALQEVKLVGQIRPHPNVMQIFGVCATQQHVFIVMAKMHSSLDKLIYHVQRRQWLTIPRMYRMAMGIVAGMLHLEKQGICHRDLAARNVCLTKGGAPCITDFGMSRKLQLSASAGETNTQMGPVAWMAPECFLQRYSEKSDVWSFGIVLYEMITGIVPHRGVELPVLAVRIRDEGLTPAPIPENANAGLVDIMRSCWAMNPDHRPTFAQISKKLREYGNIQDEDEEEEIGNLALLTSSAPTAPSAATGFASPNIKSGSSDHDHLRAAEAGPFLPNGSSVAPKPQSPLQRPIASSPSVATNQPSTSITSSSASNISTDRNASESEALLRHPRGDSSGSSSNQSATSSDPPNGNNQLAVSSSSLASASTSPEAYSGSQTSSTTPLVSVGSHSITSPEQESPQALLPRTTQIFAVSSPPGHGDYVRGFS